MLWSLSTCEPISLRLNSSQLLTITTLTHLHSISSILNSRFLLALHETSARLEGAAEASISSLSLDTGSSDDPQGGSEPPELPEFLGIIRGLIRSFHCDDKDLGSLEFAPPWEEHEPDLEPEGEIQEIRRDGGNIA